MHLNLARIKQLMENKGWTEVMLARNLNIDYSFCYRVLRKERGIGKKFLKGLLEICDKEKLNFYEFILLNEPNEEK